MSVSDEAAARAAGHSYVEWGAVFAGAVGASAIAFVLLTFGAAIGLSITSPWPGQGVSAAKMGWAVAWFSALVYIGAFAGGGYLAGRMRRPVSLYSSDERNFRDSAHGFLAWSVGVLLIGFVVASTSGSLAKLAGQGAASATITGASPTDYAVDSLLRPEPGASAPANAANADDAPFRAEATRILTSTIANREFTQRDRDYLVRVVERRTGLATPAAQQRVDAAINENRDLEIKARAAAEKARKASVVAGFVAAATLLIGMAAAIAAAAAGGRHRDDEKLPEFYGHRFW